MAAISYRRHRFPPVAFTDRLEAWGAASLFCGFKLLPLGGWNIFFTMIDRSDPEHPPVWQSGAAGRRQGRL